MWRARSIYVRAHCYVGSSTTCAKVEEKNYARGESSVKGGTERQNDIQRSVTEREGDKLISDAHVFTCRIHATKGSVLISSHGQAGTSRDRSTPTLPTVRHSRSREQRLFAIAYTLYRNGTCPASRSQLSARVYDVTRSKGNRIVAQEVSSVASQS